MVFGKPRWAGGRRGSLSAAAGRSRPVEINEGRTPEPAGAVNLAVGGAAVQSSFSQFSHADDPLRAMSGAPNGAFSFHTEHEKNPWWILDLGRICNIETLVVYNRGDSAQYRIRHFRIDIFDPAIGGWKPIYAAENEFGGILDDAPLRLNFGARPKVTRFLKLAIEGENSLHLDRVEVFGTCPQQAYEDALRQSERPHLPTTVTESKSAETRSLGAIVGLVRGYADLADYAALIARNAAIFETINKTRTTHYPLLIWHEGNILPEHQAYIVERGRNSDVRFVDVSDRWRLPLSLTRADMEEHWPVGYRLMCKFNTVDIWDLTRRFDYVLRVDEDCILTQIAADPFERMRDAGLDCAFSLLVDDTHELTNESLPPFVEAYLHVNGLKSRSTLPLTSCFPYTNVMMGRGEFFRSQKVWHFLTHVVAQREFFTKRWGDHIVLGVPLNLFSSFENVRPIEDLEYAHHSHNVIVSSNDEARVAARQRHFLSTDEDVETLAPADRVRQLLQWFKTRPTDVGVRERLTRALEASGHQAIASRLRAVDRETDVPIKRTMSSC